MPPVSKKQSRFMRAVAGGAAKAPGLSRQEAQEYVQGHSTKGLPEKTSKKGKK